MKQATGQPGGSTFAPPIAGAVCVSSTMIIPKKHRLSLVRSYAEIKNSLLKKRRVYLKCGAILPSHRQTLDGNMVVGVSCTLIRCVQCYHDIRGISAADILDTNIG